MLFSLSNLFHKEKNIYFYILASHIFFFLMTMFIYWPGLNGPFVFDDFPSIVDNKGLQLESFTVENIKTALFSVKTGPLYRPISYFTFLVNYQLTGNNPFWFKLTNVIIHFFNAALFFFFCRFLFSIIHKKKTSDLFVIGISAFSASLWAFHPLNVTGVLYVVQRMTSLSCLFFLCLLNLYFSARLKQLNGEKVGFFYFFGLLFLFMLAILSKESILTGLGILFLCEIFFFKFLGVNNKPIKPFKVISLLTFFSGLFVFFALIIEYDWLNQSYMMRDFSLKERILTEPRVIFFYVKMIVFPNIQEMSIFRDYFLVSQGFFYPVSTVISIIFLIFSFILSIVFFRKIPILCFGLSWFLIGHSLESTIFPLEIMFDHRNYFPMMGLIFIISYLLNAIRLRAAKFKYVIFIFPMVLCLFGTWIRANVWSSELTLYENEVFNYPLSARANFQLAMTYSDIALFENKLLVNDDMRQKAYKKSLHHFNLASQVSSNDISGFVGVIRLKDAFLGERDPNIENRLIERISTVPITIDTNKRLKELIECRYRDTCTITPEFLNSIINALERNIYFERVDKSGFYNDFGAITLSYGLYDAAIFYYKKAVALSPKNGDFIFGLSTAYYLKGDYEKSYEILNTIDRATLPKSYLPKYKDMDNLLEKAIRENHNKSKS